jgi:cell wall assembly regulator SMI1
MTIRFKTEGPPADDRALRNLEERLATPIPKSVVESLRRHDGGRLEPNEVDSTRAGAEAGIGVDAFLSVKDIIATVSQLGPRLASGMIPIADAAGGNLICVDQADGSIWFWDHELEDGGPLSRVAESLTEFVSFLQPFDPSEIDLTEEEKASAWVDPEFLEQYRKGRG